MSTDIKLSKSELSKIIKSGGFLGDLLGRLAGPLIKVAAPLAKKYSGTVSFYGIISCNR